MNDSPVRIKARRVRMALYGARQALGLSLAEAGALIGRSDHSAVCRAENVAAEPAASLSLALAYAEHGQRGPIEALCREAGGHFIAERVTPPAGVANATWAQLYTKTMGDVARLLDRYAGAAVDGSLSRGEHVDLAGMWRGLRDLAAAGEELHATAGEGRGGEAVNAPVAFVAPGRFETTPAHTHAARRERGAA